MIASAMSFFSVFSVFRSLAGIRFGVFLRCSSSRSILRLGLLELLAEPGVRDLESTHRRSGRLVVGRGFFSQFALKTGHLRPGLFQPPREPKPLGIAAVGRFRHFLRPVFDQRVQGKLFLHVLEVVLLTPTMKDAVGHHHGREILAVGEDRRLASVVAQHPHLPHPQIPLARLGPLAFSLSLGGQRSHANPWPVAELVLSPCPVDLLAAGRRTAPQAASAPCPCGR